MLPSMMMMDTNEYLTRQFNELTDKSSDKSRDELFLHRLALTADHVRRILDFFTTRQHGHCHVKKLTLYDCLQLTVEGPREEDSSMAIARLLANLLQEETTIQELDLRMNGFGCHAKSIDQLDVILTGLHGNHSSTITSLDLGFCDLGTSHAWHVVSKLFQNNNNNNARIQRLCLAGNRITTVQAAQELASAIAKSSVEVLDLSGCLVNDEICRAFLDALCEHGKRNVVPLQRLVMRFNTSLSPACLGSMARFMLACRNLEELNLSSCTRLFRGGHDDGALMVSQFIQLLDTSNVSSTLRQLSLRYCGMSSHLQARILRLTEEQHGAFSCLRSLDLSSNDNGGGQEKVLIQQLIQSLPRIQKLESLAVTLSCKPTPRQRQALNQAARRNGSLQDVNLGGGGFELDAEILQRNKTLARISTEFLTSNSGPTPWPRLLSREGGNCQERSLAATAACFAVLTSPKFGVECWHQ